MIMTILSHITAVRILFVIGITLTVLPIFFYKVILKGEGKFGKMLPKIITLGVVMCLPMIYYFYLDIRYDVSEFTENDKLYLAAENKNQKAAVKFIAQGADPAGETRYGMSAVYRSAMLDDAEMLKIYLEKGVDPNHTGGEGITLIAVACRNGNNEMAAMLLEAGADPDYRSDIFVPALHYAAANDKDYNAELVRMLIEAGADPASVAYRRGKTMLPYRYYFDEYYDDDDITAEDEANFAEIKDMLYKPYITWLNEKMVSENERNKAENEEAIS